MSNSEIIYREGYTEGYQQAIKDVTAYKISKIQAKKFSINELSKWKNFEDEFQDDFSTPPSCRSFNSMPKRTEKRISYVYVIKGHTLDTDHSTYKIGITRNLKERIETLQTSSPNKLQLIFKYPTYNSKQIEKSLHNHFKYYRIRDNGEWFKFSDTMISNWLRTDFQDVVSEL